MITLWLSCFALFGGVSILYGRETDLLLPFLAVGYLAVFPVVLRTARSWRDIFNPLSVVLAFGLIRFGLPGILIMLGVDPEAEIYRVMNLQWESLQLGHVLALTSLSGVVLGWFLLPGRPREQQQLKGDFGKAVRDVAVIAMVVGFGGLIQFVAGNVSVTQAAFEGTLRGITIQPGTGKFFFLAHLLIVGSIILSGYFSSPKVGRASIALVPVFLAMSSFWVLGGRLRALSPVLQGLLILWYGGRERRKWPAPSLKFLSAMVLIGIPLLTWISYFGQLYRGGGGIQALPESLSFSGLWEYIRYSIFNDIGHLHALAGAVSIRPAILEGTTFIHSFLWPLSQVLELPGRSPGVVIVEILGGFGPRRGWGLAPGLIGETYMNFGPLGVPVMMTLYGLVLKALYIKFRRGRLHLAVYVIAVYQLISIFWGGIGVWIYMLVVVAFALSIFKTAQAVARLKYRPDTLAQQRPMTEPS